jgi:hypothetical protein
MYGILILKMENLGNGSEELHDGAGGGNLCGRERG